MVLIEIQNNIIKSKTSLEYLENDFVYKLSKTITGNANFELAVRGILNASIDLRNKIIVQVQSVIRKSENKDLIALIDSGYFRKISEAMSRESLIRVVHVSGGSIPETSARVVAENKEIDEVMHNIANEIKTYNDTISRLKQERNRFFLKLYSMPSSNQLPKEIEGSINLATLVSTSERPLSSSFVSPMKEIPTEPKTTAKPKTEGKLKIRMRRKS